MTDRARIQAMLSHAVAMGEAEDVDVDYVSYYTREAQPAPHSDDATGSKRGAVGGLQLPERPTTVAQAAARPAAPVPSTRTWPAATSRDASSTPPRPHAQPAPSPMGHSHAPPPPGTARRGTSPARKAVAAPSYGAAVADAATVAALEAQIHALTGQLEMWRTHAATATEALEVAFQENERLASRIRELEVQGPAAVGAAPSHASGVEQASWHGRVHGTAAVATIASGWLRVCNDEQYYVDCEIYGLKINVAGAVVSMIAANGAAVEFVFDSAAYARGFATIAGAAAATLGPFGADSGSALKGPNPVASPLGDGRENHKVHRAPAAPVATHHMPRHIQPWSDAELLAAVEDVVSTPHPAPALAFTAQSNVAKRATNVPAARAAPRATTPVGGGSVAHKRPTSVSRRLSEAPTPRPSTAGRAPSWTATPRPTYAALHAAAAASSPFPSAARHASPAVHSTRADAMEILRAGMPALPSRVEALRRSVQP